MAFVIPSKHIYNKDNDKLRDNKIDRIEVGAFEILPNNEYEIPVYNSQIDMSQTLKEERDTQQSGDYLDVNGYNIDIGGIATKAVDRYATISEIKIAKNKGNKTITKIYNEKKENSGTSYTQISKYIEEKTFYYESNNAYTYNNDETSNYGSFNFDVISSIQPEEKELQSSNSIQDIFSNSKVKFTADFNGGNDKFFNRWSFTKGTPELNYNIHAVLDYGENISIYKDFPKDEGSDLSSLTIESDDEYYYIKNLKVLIGRTIYCCATALRLNIPLSSYIGSSFPCKIVEIQRNVEKAEVTVYGNTIGIDLTDKTIYIPNQSGNKPFFVEGNELMQTNYLVDVPFNVSNLVVKTRSISGGTKRAWIELANGVATNNKIKIKANIVAEGATTPTSEEFVIYKNNFKSGEKTITVYSTVEIISATIEDTQISELFSKTLSSYSQGKETATIRCAIADYINYISATVVEYIKYDEENRVFCILDVKNDYLAQKILQAENLKINDIEFMVADAEDTKIYINFYSLSIVPYLEKGTLTIPLKEIDINNNNGKMAFDIYDEVIPMVYTANQTDKPMSRYKDGSAKTFVVLWPKIYFDGAVWQELTLQEK